VSEPNPIHGRVHGDAPASPDRGLATERTQLAWQRYSLGIAIIAALSLRAGLRGQHEVIAFGIAFLLAAVATAMQYRGPIIEPQTAVRLALAASLLAAAGALVLALL
jgi:uncharacterized membrane protein YidH (DUF202 family)